MKLAMAMLLLYSILYLDDKASETRLKSIKKRRNYKMKFIWAIAALGILILGAGNALLTSNEANAGLLDSLATGNWPVKESTAFKVEAYGFDFRVYEWQTESDPNTFCTVAVGNSSSAPYTGLNCFQKTK